MRRFRSDNGTRLYIKNTNKGYYLYRLSTEGGWTKSSRGPGHIHNIYVGNHGAWKRIDVKHYYESI